LYGASQYSDIQYFFTKRIVRTEKYVKLYVKGTGRNNHDNALVKINDITVFENGKYQGLALLVIERANFQVKEILYYDTISKEDPNTTTVQKTTYSYKQDGTLNKIVESVDKKITTKYSNAMALYNKLLSLTEDKLFILVSCYGWEKYFTPELADLLTKYGALNILELKTYLTKEDLDTKINQKSVLNNHYYYHPYAFVGIPNIGPGNGYESFRTNKGHYLSTNNLPSAELVIKFKYNKYARNYYFDDRQYYPRYSYKDDYDYLFKSEDYSLRNVIDLLLYKNITTTINTGFSIYDNINNKEVIYSSGGVLETELDRVVFGPGVGAKRYSVNGTIIQDGKVLEDEMYYSYYYSNVFNNMECNLNNINSACPSSDLLGLNNPILQCKIGLTPNFCFKNIKFEFLFLGFNN
jgi:hypothetical protein